MKASTSNLFYNMTEIPIRQYIEVSYNELVLRLGLEFSG